MTIVAVSTAGYYPRGRGRRSRMGDVRGCRAGAHERKQWPRRQHGMQFVVIGDIEHADIRLPAGDAPEVQPVVVMAQLKFCSSDRGRSIRPRALPVESECGAVAVGRTYLLPPLSSGGALLIRPWLRFHTPLIEPDMQIYRIRLSDKTSRLHPRRAAPKPGQTYEPEVPVEVREWISPASASPDFVFGPQPPAQPHRCVAVERAIGWD
jgi:hypothetical protein